MVVSASPRPILFFPSAAWLTRMTAAGLKISYFDPIISKKKP
jgi:hypothetical protein